MKQAIYTLVVCLIIVISFPAAAQKNDSDTKSVTILAVNDIHSTIDMFPKFAAIVDSVRNIHPNLLLLSAGDNQTGNPINDHHEIPGYPITDLMNRIGFNASAVGNHDFDANIASLRNLIGMSNFRYLCANIEAHDSLRLHTAPYRFFECNGVRIGVLGLIQTGSNGMPDSHPDNLAGLQFRPALDAVRDYAWMRQQCDIFILLTHLGYEEDLRLAAAFPEADIIIGGHSHTAIPNGVLKNGLIITQTEGKLRHITELQIEVSGGRITNKEHKFINVNATKMISKEIQIEVDKYNDNETLKQILTIAATPFDNEEELGCLITDAQRAETNSDIAIMNCGGIRYKMRNAGEFLMRDAYMLDPFNNSIIAFEMTGEEVQQMIAAAYEIGEDPYVSGITYNVSFNPDKSVKKVSAFMPSGKPISLKKNYRVAINSYLASVCPFTKSRTGSITSISSTNALIEYLKKQPSVSYQGVKRVNIVNTN